MIEGSRGRGFEGSSEWKKDNPGLYMDALPIFWFKFASWKHKDYWQGIWIELKKAKWAH